MIPVIPVPGNHENIAVYPDGDQEAGRIRARTTLWRPQFTLPVDQTLPETLRESTYDVRYSEDLHIFVVDSARTTFEAQAEWLDRKLGESDAMWKVVSLHHPYFLPEAFDRGEDDALRREALSEVIDRHGVDLVLTGHVHTYGRSTLTLGDQPTASRAASGEPRDIKTVFVISASGAKNSDIWNEDQVEEIVGDGEPDFQGLSVDRVAGNTPMFQVIRIDGSNLSYEARTAIGTLYDSFQLTKAQDGQKTLVEGAVAFGDTRLFSNTGPYREWWDLR